MPKHVLVALPLSDAQRSALQASVPEYEFIFAQTETVTLAQVLEADIIMGNVPVELICQNHHLEWFQSNFAGPDTYLVPGVLPEQCLVTNATGAYGLAISEWMLGLWLGLQKDLFLYRDRQTQHKWDAITRQVRPVAGSRVLCVGMGDIGSNFAMRAHALGAEVVGVRRSVRPGAPCPDYCLRVVPQSELDAETRRQLEHGKALMEMLKQPLCQPKSDAEQVVILVLASHGLLDTLPTAEQREKTAAFVRQFRADVSGTMQKIDADGKLEPDRVDAILNAWKAYAGGNDHVVQ